MDKEKRYVSFYMTRKGTMIVDKLTAVQYHDTKNAMDVKVYVYNGTHVRYYAQFVGFNPGYKGGLYIVSKCHLGHMKTINLRG